MADERKSEILELNKKQTVFYNAASQQRRLNPIMKLWRVLRRRMYFLMSHSTIWSDVYDLQKEWMGNLSGKKVLDFGCYDGNALSTYLAANAGNYLGVDLSSNALERLAEHFAVKGISDARLKCVDILSPEFTEADFDIIYAQGVLHHFHAIDVILPVLSEKLKPGGRIVSLDPLQTSPLTQAFRKIYHPFRSDREWEWPFTRRTFTAIRRYFHIHGLQGVIGRTKWAIPLVFIFPKLAVRLAQKFHQQDLALAKSENGYLWGCMQLVMCLEKREG